MNGGANVWAVTPEERLKHDQKFDTLAPSMGYVSGEQARKFFLQSGLPASVLAEIWALADMNKDGKMDRLEFSIAMKLVKLKLQGTPLPSVLPGIMKQPPVAVPNLSYGMMQNMSLMPGTNLSMFTPVSMATPGPTSLPSMAGHNLGFIQPMAAGTLATGLPLSASSYGSLLASSATLPPSSMTAQMAAGLGEWGVPHASRLKYRQHFNVLDKQMTGYLTGQQVRGAMATTMLSQTQLASIWNLADVDKDGKLSAEEFILAMHLVDVAKSGQPLPRTLPTDLVPPTQRSLANGSSVSNYAALYDNFDVELTQQARSNMSFEDKFKANMDRGNAELEKRRLALLEAEKKEQERQAQKAREEQERREKEAREAEERRRKEEERRLERQRELERKREEERQREIERKEAAQRELERQRKEEFQRRKRGELQIKRQQEQDDIIQLKAKKRSLEMELEAVGNKQRQISDRLHDIQNKKKLPRTELDLVNQRKDARHLDIKNIQQQIEEFQKKLALLSPEQKRLTETLQSMAVNNLSVSAISNLKLNVNQKRGACTNLKTQLEALERETAAKLEELDRYNKNMQELKASQQMQQAALENLRSIKEDKKQELIRKKQEHEERRKLEEERRRQEEEAQRLIKLEKERQWKEKLRRDEEERQRRLQEEREAKQREEEEKERQALIQAAKLEAERELRAKQEEERKRREEEERKKREEEERRRQIERQRQEEERRKLEEERRQLEAERKKLEEDKRMEERKRKEEEERLKREEERRRLEEERLRKQEQEAEERRRLEEERRKEMERVEEERRRQRAAQAAVRDSEERRRLEEEERRRKEQQEEERRKREEEKRKLQHQQEDDRRRREEERKRAEEDRKRKVQEEEKKRKEHQSSGGGKIDIQEKLNSLLRGLEERKGRQPRTMQSSKSVTLTPFRSLYPFTARNHEELTFNADEMIEVDETVEPEEGWLYGHRQGLMGWFPKSYVERVGQSDLAAPAPPPKLPIQSQLSNALEAAKVAGTKSAFTPTHSPNSTHSDTPGQQVVGNLLAQALCSWTAKTDNHLNFEKDDVIQVLEQQDSWWLGNLKGEQGWFPKSYVTLVGEGDSSDVTNSTSGGAEMSNNQQFEEYTALYPYESSEASDLTFREGDVILVTKKDGEWWNGVIADRSGAFPGTYVKPKEADVSTKKREIGKVTRAHSSSVPGQLNLENGQLIVVLSKDASGWWLGEQQARGKKRQKGWFPSSHIQILASNSGKSTPAVQSGVCQVIALYDYVAANKDDLSFSANQLITVLDKSNPDWWKGEVNGATGLFPTNYVKMITGDGDPSHQWCADLTSLESLSPLEKKRQGYIHELLQTEERYVEDLQTVLEVFHKPMSESGRLTSAEINMIFANWKELISCNTKLLRALSVRKKSGGENMPVHMVGDILVAELSHMHSYIRFCSCQSQGAALLQTRTDNEPDFKSFLQKISSDYRCKGMPLSSFLLKPMQRITRYPLHIKSILECTAEGHPDRGPLKEALERAEELCQQVNEGVRDTENLDRLEWIQNHVLCDGAAENIVFNSITNCLGPRKLLHSGKIYKVKSNKELWAFLFNDFLLLTHSGKQFTSSGIDKLFSTKNNTHLKMYKPPIMLNEVLVKLPDPSSDDPVFHVSHIDTVYILRTENINERTAWVQKIKAASEESLQKEKKKRDRAFHSRSLKGTGMGRLLVTVLEASELKAVRSNGKMNPYCEVTLGSQVFTSRTLNDTTYPKWNFNCQFQIKDIYQDVLSITIYERDPFAPDDFLGRTEVPMANIKKELESKGGGARRLALQEVSSGEVWVRFDLQLFNGK